MANSSKKASEKGYPIALLSAVILSTSAIFVRHLTEKYGLPPIILSFWRDLFVAIVLLIILVLIRPSLLRITRQNLYYLIIYGFVLAVFNSVWTLSVSLNGAAVGTVLAYCSAAFTALLGWWILKESLSWVKVLLFCSAWVDVYWLQALLTRLPGRSIWSGLSPGSGRGYSMPYTP